MKNYITYFILSGTLLLGVLAMTSGKTKYTGKISD